MKSYERITFFNLSTEEFVSHCQLMAGEFNDATSSRPKGTPPNLKLRFDLIDEEVKETIKAIVFNDEVEIIDGLCDILYVTYGAAHVLGMSLNTERYEKQKTTGITDKTYLLDSISDLRWQVHWIAVDIMTNDMQALRKDLTELAIQCWEIGYKGLGLDLFPFYEEVHKTNMAKLGGPKREDGKQLKPPGWQPPRIAEILAELRNSK